MGTLIRGGWGSRSCRRGSLVYWTYCLKHESSRTLRYERSDQKTRFNLAFSGLKRVLLFRPPPLRLSISSGGGRNESKLGMTHVSFPCFLLHQSMYSLLFCPFTLMRGLSAEAPVVFPSISSFEYSFTFLIITRSSGKRRFPNLKSTQTR